MMFDSVLVKVSCSEELLYLHTISRRHKSPYRFAILRDTLEQLEREPGRQIIVADCGCYAALRLTRALDGEMLVIRFSWLQSAGADSLRGYEEWVRLPSRQAESPSNRPATAPAAQAGENSGTPFPVAGCGEDPHL